MRSAWRKDSTIYTSLTACTEVGSKWLLSSDLDEGSPIAIDQAECLEEGEAAAGSKKAMAMMGRV